MEDPKKQFSEYIAKCFKERLKELGLTPYRFERKNADLATHQTWMRIMKGDCGMNSNTLASICDRLGLEIIIRKKEEHREDNN